MLFRTELNSQYAPRTHRKFPEYDPFAPLIASRLTSERKQLDLGLLTVLIQALTIVGTPTEVCMIR